MIKRAVLFLATFVLIAGCGSEEGGGDGGDGGGKDDDPLAMLAHAARKTSAESFRFKATVDSDISSETMKMDAGGTSTADSTEATMKGTIDLGDGDMEFEAITTGDNMYMAGEDLGVPEGKWLATQEPATQTMAPSQFVNFLRESGDVELLGTEEVQGEQAQHFRGPLNMKELIEKSADSAFLEQMKKTPGVEELDVVIDIWVPDSGLPSRMSIDMKMPGQDGSLKMTSEILEYDVPVNADPPPDDQIVESPTG